MEYNVLHITPHFGGGVGTVLTELVTELNRVVGFNHEVVCLDVVNEKARIWSNKSGVKIHECIAPDSLWLHSKMQDADIVQLHFWNHPALYLLMYSFSGKKARIVLWAHVNGLFAPYRFNKTVLDFPELFVLSTDYSFQEKTISSRSEQWRQKHVRSVHSTAGLNGFDRVRQKPHNGFNVGYVGTVDYVKMHRDFIDICASTEIADCRFIVCGGDKENEIFSETKMKGVAEKFDFRGKISEIKEAFSEFDIFAYPLNRKNYGTGEQALIEAMSAGVPQIVFDDGPEENVVEDGVTGIVVSSNSDFSKAIETLYKDKNLREQMSENSKKYALEHYGLKQTVDQWIEIYKTLLSRKARKHDFKCCLEFLGSHASIPLQLFFLALGECEAKELFIEALKFHPNEITPELQTNIKGLPDIFLSETRGSVKHYNSFLYSNELKYLSKLI